MGTFTEFYMALLKFVNFKLYADLGLSYPLSELPIKDEVYQATEVHHMQANARKLFERGDEQDTVVDTEFQHTPEML